MVAPLTVQKRGEAGGDGKQVVGKKDSLLGISYMHILCSKRSIFTSTPAIDIKQSLKLIYSLVWIWIKVGEEYLNIYEIPGMRKSN